MRFHHIGIACKNIEEGIAGICSTHDVVAQSEVMFDPQQDAQVVLLTLADGTKMEMVSGKQVETFTRKNITYYHVCFETDDIDAQIKRLVSDGALLIAAPKPAILFSRRLVAFLQVSYGMIELLSST